MMGPSSGVLRDHEPRRDFEEALETALETLPGALALLEQRGRILHANERFAALGDVPPPQARGAQLCDLFGGELARRLTEERIAALATWQAPALDCAAITRAGRRLYLRALLRPAAGAAGAEPRRYVLELIDLTEDEARQEALREQESRFRGIIESTGELTMLVDPDGRLRYVNPRVPALTGQPADALIGRSPLELFHASSHSELAAALERSRERPHDTIRLERLRLGAVSECHVQMELTTLPETPGIEGTVVTCQVITDKLKTEQELRASQSRLSTTFHASPDAILILQYADGTIIDFNTGFSRLLGYGREEAIGRTEAELELWAQPRHRAQLMSRLGNELEVRDQEAQLIAKNGELLPAEISIKLVELEGELCVMCVGRDTTRRRQAETALRESEEKFARIFFNNPDGIVIIDMENGRIVDVNEAFLNSLEYEREQLLRRRIQQLPLLADEANLTSIRELLRERSTVNNIELVFRARSGETFPALVSATQIDINGRANLVCLVKDNRRQRDTELMLQRSEERFRGAFENAPIGMLLASPEGFVFQANNFAYELLTAPEDELIGANLSSLVPMSERRALKETLSRLLHREQDVSRGERRMLCHNGMEIWTNFHVVVQRNDQGEALYFIVQIADVTEMRQSQERMEHMAFYDTLTDLANRRLFSNRLEQAIQHVLRSDHYAALLYLDLDQFKRVNDTLGHEAGDELLREVGRRLRQCVRNEDTVARPGGDEFTILLHTIASPGDAGHVARKILERLRAPVTLAGHQLVVTTSIGVTVIPDDSVHPNELTKNADLAMYRAKDRGRNTYQYYSEDMNTRALERLRTENELRVALAEHELELHFQPKLRLEDERIIGAECLLRWQHPERGVIMPEEFIGVAEENGAIVEVGKWVIAAACKALESINGGSAAPMQLGINISPRQFRDPNLVTTIREALAESQVDPSLLELEITETMLMDDTDSAALTIHRLQELGVRIAIDDFGTGYSSLNHLRRFPIQAIKVDRSFVMDIPASSDDAAVTGAVIAMAHRLNLEVVAEGIETEAQLAFLKEQHCEYGQGFYFSEPLPLHELQGLLAAQHRDRRARAALSLHADDGASARLRRARAPTAPPPVHR